MENSPYQNVPSEVTITVADVAEANKQRKQRGEPFIGGAHYDCPEVVAMKRHFGTNVDGSWKEDSLWKKVNLEYTIFFGKKEDENEFEEWRVTQLPVRVQQELKKWYATGWMKTPLTFWVHPKPWRGAYGTEQKYQEALAAFEARST